MSQIGIEFTLMSPAITLARVGTQRTVVATCTAGMKMIGGGCRANHNQTYMVLEPIPPVIPKELVLLFNHLQ